MSWRPKDWENVIDNYRNWQDPSEIELFEAGADAILRALRKLAQTELEDLLG